jgi:transposase
MNSTTTIGIDLAKSVFQVHGVDAEGRVTVARQLKRRQVLTFFAKLPPCLVGMEACASAHHWGRELTRLGHTVKPLVPKHVKAYVRRGKTDAADAEAICEAVSRPRLKAVPIKSVEQQAALMQHKVREQTLGIRTQLINAMRGHMAELGIVAPEGARGVAMLLAIVRDETNEALPAAARDALLPTAMVLAAVEASIAAVERAIRVAHKSNETSRRLETVPIVGELTAAAMAATVTDPTAFKSGRAFAAWIGITARLEGTGGEVRLGSITKQGNGYLRRLLYLGAVAKLGHVQRNPAKADPWLVKLLETKPFKVAAIALANKTARIIWALLVRGGTYQANYRPTAYLPAEDKGLAMT